jgi:ssDNA-binding Zn-finger/Zn-ribbon topoisomerase 1
MDADDADALFGGVSGDVDLDEGLFRLPNSRADLKCGDCGALMVLRPSKHGPFYACTRFPDCRGTHGAHPDGSPKGTPANKETREARIKAHFVFDQIWKNNYMRRREAYRWLRNSMSISHSEAHIGHFDQEQCEKLIKLVYAAFPKLQTRYSRLAWGEFDGV